MQWLNNFRLNKNRIAYLTALTLLFSYAEFFLPKIVPFLHLGLANAVILLAFDLDFFSFFMLTVLKALTSSLMGGTLISPFVIISLGQSVLSGIFMYGLAFLNRLAKGKLLSVYGISAAGSVFSGIVQIFLASIYIGTGIFMLSGPVLVFNFFSGIVTAFLCQTVRLPDEVPVSESLKEKPVYTENKGFLKKHKNLILAVLILTGSCIVFFISNIPVLLVFWAVSLVFQKISGRRIFIMPYVFLWLFVVISSLFVPGGKVILEAGKFSVTEGALFSGIEKALKLSTVTALSQCAAGLKVSSETTAGLALLYYREFLDRFRNTEGNLLKKLKAVVGNLTNF